MQPIRHDIRRKRVLDVCHGRGKLGRHSWAVMREVLAFGRMHGRRASDFQQVSTQSSSPGQATDRMCSPQGMKTKDGGMLNLSVTEEGSNTQICN